MIPILDLLNKIKWDKREKPKEYSIFYFDRILKNLIEIKFEDIKKIEGNFMILERNGEEANIPLHRVREVRRLGRLIWTRKSMEN